MFQAALFDMDGLLIDSEPLWWQAEIAGFGEVGLHLTEDDCRKTVGVGLNEVVALRFSQQPWNGLSQSEVAERIHRKVIALVKEQGRALPGVCQCVRLMRSLGCKLGLATTSDGELIDAALSAIGLEDAFDHLQSAQDLEHKKPHPEVFLECARQLGADAQACVVFEDSIPGLIAAKAARMTAVAVPDAAHRNDPRYAIADVKLDSLEQVDRALLQSLLD
jgi:sugar-phosphatase